MSLCFVNQSFSFQCPFSIHVSVCEPDWEAEITSGLPRWNRVLKLLRAKSRLIAGFIEDKSFVTQSDIWGGRQIVKTAQEADPQAKS